jgi:hypothetical protein
MKAHPMNEALRYSLPEPLLQAIVNLLNELPAGRVRPLLNAIEGECLQQDQAAATVQTPAPSQRRKKRAPTP